MNCNEMKTQKQNRIEIERGKERPMIGSHHRKQETQIGESDSDVDWNKRARGADWRAKE